MEKTSKDLLRFEHRDSSSSIESALLVCNKGSNSKQDKPNLDGKPLTTGPLPKSNGFELQVYFFYDCLRQSLSNSSCYSRLINSALCCIDTVLSQVKDFLGVISQSNKNLEMNAKDNPENYDIEVLKDGESEYIEMDLMLGVADLQTPEAVTAAEAAINGRQPVINLPVGSSSSDSEESSEEDDEEEDDDDSSFSDSEDDEENVVRKPNSKHQKDSPSGDKPGRGSVRNKRPKIVELP
ncbi:hypothetical protein V2J09_005860 [Rumex salicifolius]